MATDKQPAFPHPALEVGVPQYPTPNVPDFYKKDGHIILVDKISADKGSYNPAPLDGSVTYSGKDANKFPAPLYLVRETPTPDGLFVFRTWANDRTYASQDPWNYGVSYSSENPDYPIYTREYFTPRDQYTPIAIGVIDPLFGGTAIVAKQEMKELAEDHPLRSRHVQVMIQYETIPGPVIFTKEIDPISNVTPILSSTQKVVNSKTNKASASLGIVQEYEDIDSIASKFSTKDYSSLIGVTWTEYENESYSPPAILYVRNAFWAGSWNLSNILTYVRPQSKTITAKVEYTITKEATTTECFNPVTRTLITDLGTFTNVLHNVESYISGGIVVYNNYAGIYGNSMYSSPNSSQILGDVTLRFSSTRIPKMGGLYIQKTTTIPFSSLYSSGNYPSF